MPRVLIVTSMYLPCLAADSHRARLLAEDLPDLGWDVEILAPDDVFHPARAKDPHAALVQTRVPVHKAAPRCSKAFDALSLRSAGWRAYLPLRKEGDVLLARGRFDLVYFSCAQPLYFNLGERWRRRFGVPFVLDFQDPWYWPELPAARHLTRWKWRLSNALAGRLERTAVSNASALISVSPAYLRELAERYPGERSSSQAVIPFAGSTRDLELAMTLPARLAAEPGKITIVYAGTGGAIMEKSLRRLGSLMREAERKQRGLLDGARLLLFGTEPDAGPGGPYLTRVARETGLSGILVESPARLGYLEALRLASEADGLVVLGVDQPGYSPSKLYLYGLTGKPLLACMPAGSVVDAEFARYPQLGRLVHFGDARSDQRDIDSTVAFLADVRRRSVRREPPPSEWLSPAMARRHAELFWRCLAPREEGV